MHSRYPGDAICHRHEHSQSLCRMGAWHPLEFTVAVADVLPASVFTATLLRAACCACDRLVLDRASLVGVTQDELADALVLERVSRAIALCCASLSNEVDWASDSALQAWLRAIRDFYYPRPLSNI